MSYYIDFYKKYFNHNGRASRKEMWLVSIIHFIFYMLLSVLDGYFGLYTVNRGTYYGYTGILFILFGAIPFINLLIRRYHDVDKDPIWILINIIPIASFYGLYLAYFKQGTPGENRFDDKSDIPTDNIISYSVEYAPVTPEAPSIVKNYDFESHITNIEPKKEEDVELYTPTHSEVKFCYKCGKRLVEGASFCCYCGTKVFKE